MTPKYSLALSGKHYEQLKQHLFPGDGKEAVALALCGRSACDRGHRFLVHSLFPVPYEACRIREEHRVTWSPESVVPALTMALNQGLCIVKIHSHPNGYDDFSPTDNRSDEAFFSSVFGWLDSDEPQASMIMLPDRSMFGRTIWPDHIGEPLEEIRVAGDDILVWRDRVFQGDTPEHARRIAQTFGEKTYGLLSSLRIGVVGCSGTGSLVIEQLARNCVGELVLVDPDHVESKNLNRILNSTLEDAQQEHSKVEVMQRAIASMGLGTKVYGFEVDLMNEEVIRKLASCDVLFGCMDSVDGRHVLNKLASFYLVPLIDVGVRIDADGGGGIDKVCAAVHYIQPGGSSLMSRGVYSQEDLDAAFMKRRNPKQYSQLLKEGYVRNARVDQPAVISINMQAASLAVNEFLARVHPYRVESNSEYAYRCQVLSDPAASLDSPDGQPCHSFAARMGYGDVKPLLGLHGLLN